MSNSTQTPDQSAPAPRKVRRHTKVWRKGDGSKKNPFSILILNNMALERPLGSGNFVPDLVGTGTSAPDRILFDTSARYIVQNLFGDLPGQAERLLADSPHARKIRVTSMYVTGLAARDANALVGELGTELIVARRDTVTAMLAYLGVKADIVFVVSNSSTHSRATAYGTTDDDTRGGMPFTYDSAVLNHRYYHLIPGMSAMHTSSRALTAAHEFGHAFSSYTNGFVADLYVDGGDAFNRKVGRPIPDLFAVYDGTTYLSDKVRDSLGYPDDWMSYHPELIDPTQPALMDNFFYSVGEVGSRHDRITKQYILDRIEAKVLRA